MRHWLIAGVMVMCGIFLVLTPFLGATEEPVFRDTSHSLAVSGVQNYTLPLYFIPNKGQVNETAKFYAKTSRFTLWMTEEGLVFDSLKKINDSESSPLNFDQRGMTSSAEYMRDVSRLVFVNASKKPEMVPVNMSEHQVNYIKGKTQSQWVMGINTSMAVLYKDIYKNIDLKVYGVERQIEYDWIVKTGANPGSIRFRYENVKRTYIDCQGDLIIETSLGELTHKRPVSFQEKNGKKQTVNAIFKKVGENEYAIEVGDYDHSCELIIDPIVLVYSTYLGGTSDEYGVGLAVDSNGSAYLTGDTFSTDFPRKGAYQNTFGGGDKDAFVAKFSASGSSLIYSTFIGGSANDEGEGIRLDSNGRAYVVGFTSSSDFPTMSPVQNVYGGGNNDVFVLILSSTGSSLAYSTFLGGSGDDQGYAIALDSSKNIYVTGQTGSSDFPTANAYRDTFTPGGGNEYDAFVTKIAASGSSLSFSTYIGGSKNETGWGIAVSGGNAFIAGRTSSTNFPTKNEYQGTYGGGEYDAFVAKFSTVGNSLIYSTFLGGTLNDVAWGIDVDSSGCAYVTGTTFSTNFPVYSPYQYAFAGGDRDIFLTKLSTVGTSLIYSTFLGGSEAEAGAHLLLSNGNVYIVGYTSSTDFPLKRAYQDSYSGDLDGMVAMFNSTGSLIFSTFLGGSDVDSGRGIGIDSNGDIYVAGYTESTDFPTKSAYQNTLKGNKEAFVTKFSTSEFGTLCGAVDNCGLNWTSGGSAKWFEQTTVTYYDGDSAQSGAINEDETSYIQTIVNGPGELKFWWKIAAGYDDYLKFYIDGVEKSNINSYTGSNGSNWAQKTYDIGNGSHTLKWVYEKNQYWYHGNDRCFLDKVEFNSETSISLNRTQLTFGSTQGITTGSQTFTVSDAAGGSLNWSVASDQTWVTCSPGSGTGDGVVTVAVNPAGKSSGTYTGNITISAPYATNSPQTVAVTLKVYNSGHSSVPVGLYETPTNNSTIRSSVPFTGWVVDDLGVQSIKLYRKDGNTMNYIGDAIFVEGARPDVELAYPGYPYNYRAGWGYMMLTNFLPNGGNGVYNIVAIATDLEGHQVTLGTKTVTVDNASAVKPFGAIDTPSQGGIATGANYVNWGWVLTPQPNSIPTNGSTLKVWVDGVFLGNPTYNIYRSDIATLFPNYTNSSGAAGYYHLNTTGYGNGVHTIQWTATDNAGNSDGIGSRYFIVQNSSQRNGQQSLSINNDNTIPVLRQPVSYPPEQGVMVDYSAPVGVYSGYQTDRVPMDMEMKFPDDDGFIVVNTKETERIELHLGAPLGSLSGWLKVANEYRPLPPGSYLDSDTGIFYWQMGVAYTGKYHLIFIDESKHGNSLAKNVLVNIMPKY